MQYFFWHFFAFTARLQSENVPFHILSNMKQAMASFAFSFWTRMCSLEFNCKRVANNSALSKWVWIFAIKTERMWIHFLSNFFTAGTILRSYWTSLLSMTFIETGENIEHYTPTVLPTTTWKSSDIFFFFLIACISWYWMNLESLGNGFIHSGLVCTHSVILVI